MFHLHFRRNLRSFVFLLATTAVIACFSLLWWANSTGLPTTWRQKIELALEEKGAFVQLGSLRVDPLRGLVASGVTVFSDSSHHLPLATLDRVTFDFDKAKLARGKVIVNRVELVNGSLTLPVNPHDPGQGTLTATKVHGTLLMPGGRRFEFRRARGIVAGIGVNLDARIIGWQNGAAAPPDPAAAGRRRELLARVVEQFEVWHFDPDHPPMLDVVLDGDLNSYDTLRARMRFKAEEIEKNDHTLQTVEAEMEAQGDLITVTRASATDSRGRITGHADYDLSERAGRFDFSSSLDVPALLKSWISFDGLPDLKVAGEQELSARGSFSLPAGAAPVVSVTGSVDCHRVRFRDTSFQHVSSSYAWRDGMLFLRDFIATGENGTASGKILVQPPHVRFACESTLPFASYAPFLEKQEILRNLIHDFEPRAKATQSIRLDCSFVIGDSAAWSASGDGRFTNTSFRGVPIRSASCKFELDHAHHSYHDGAIEFDYTDYPLRNSFGGPASGSATVGRVFYDHPKRMLEISNVTGTMWPVPLVRLFAPKIVPNIEPYRFHAPPLMSGGGVVDVTPRGRTDLAITFSSTSPAGYTLFGKPVTLGSPSGKVFIRGNDVTVKDLKVAAFEGTAEGTIISRDGKLDTDIRWSDLSIPEIGKTYDFEMKGGGRVTGRVDCTTKGGEIRSTQGEGLLAIDKAELFSVPMFGPLSNLISGALNDQHRGYQQAKSAFFTFRIRDGVMSTTDFRTSTKSLTFAGDGHLDLRDMTFAMTMRMNAKGLLGLITLPLKPFYGMFQFRGSGPLRKPTWENVMFTRPPKEQDEILEAPPRARPVEEEIRPPRAMIVR